MAGMCSSLATLSLCLPRPHCSCQNDFYPLWLSYFLYLRSLNSTQCLPTLLNQNYQAQFKPDQLCVSFSIISTTSFFCMPIKKNSIMSHPDNNKLYSVGFVFHIYIQLSPYLCATVPMCLEVPCLWYSLNKSASFSLCHCFTVSLTPNRHCYSRHSETQNTSRLYSALQELEGTTQPSY